MKKWRIRVIGKFDKSFNLDYLDESAVRDWIRENQDKYGLTNRDCDQAEITEDRRWLNSF